MHIGRTERQRARVGKNSSSQETQRIADLQQHWSESREMRFTFRIRRLQKMSLTNECSLAVGRRNNNNRVIARRHPKALWRRSIWRGVREGEAGKQRSFLFTIQSNPLITLGTRPYQIARHSLPRLREVSERISGGCEARPVNGLRGFDPSDSDAVKGKGSSRVGKEEREREGGNSVAHGRAAADKSDRCCVDEIGESLLCTQWVIAGTLENE